MGILDDYNKIRSASPVQEVTPAPIQNPAQAQPEQQGSILDQYNALRSKSSEVGGNVVPKPSGIPLNPLPQAGQSKFSPLTSEIIGKTPEGRDIYRNEDGTGSSERSRTVESDGRYYNIPMIFGGQELENVNDAADIIFGNGLIDPETGKEVQSFGTLREAEIAAVAKSRAINVPQSPVEKGKAIKELAGQKLADVMSPKPEIKLPDAGKNIMAVGETLLHLLSSFAATPSATIGAGIEAVQAGDINKFPDAFNDLVEAGTIFHPVSDAGKKLKSQIDGAFQFAFNEIDKATDKYADPENNPGLATFGNTSAKSLLMLPFFRGVGKFPERTVKDVATQDVNPGADVPLSSVGQKIDKIINLAEGTPNTNEALSAIAKAIDILKDSTLNVREAENFKARLKKIQDTINSRIDPTPEAKPKQTPDAKPSEGVSPQGGIVPDAPSPGPVDIKPPVVPSSIASIIEASIEQKPKSPKDDQVENGDIPATSATEIIDSAKPEPKPTKDVSPQAVPEKPKEPVPPAQAVDPVPTQPDVNAQIKALEDEIDLEDNPDVRAAIKQEIEQKKDELAAIEEPEKIKTPEIDYKTEIASISDEGSKATSLNYNETLTRAIQKFEDLRGRRIAEIGGEARDKVLFNVDVKIGELKDKLKSFQKHDPKPDNEINEINEISHPVSDKKDGTLGGKPSSDPEATLYIGTGDILRSESGRILSPAPKIEGTSDRKTQNSIKRMNTWLLEEARKEVAGDDYRTTLLKAIDVNNMSMSDQDTVRIILFGDGAEVVPNAQVKHLVSRGGSSPKADTDSNHNDSIAGNDGNDGNDPMSGIKHPTVPQKVPEKTEVKPYNTETSLADDIALRLRNGEKLDNPAIKKILADRLKKDSKELTDEELKSAQEDIEVAVNLNASEIISESRKSGKTTKEIFDQLVKLYQNQPTLKFRSSTSIANQAYSTPVPLGFLAGELARIHPAEKVFEPTAGNGALLIGTGFEGVLANEIDPVRAKNLKAQNFQVTEKNAEFRPGEKPIVPDKSQDVVIMNPPFGGIGEHVDFEGFKLRNRDHLIAAQSLKAMKDDGRAVLILGASMIKGKMSEADRVFFNYLYSHYNVADHFDVSGKLYSRQGASFPIRVITIAGRIKSKTFAPKGDILRVESFPQLFERFEDGLKKTESIRSDGRGATDNSSIGSPSELDQGSSDATGVQSPAGKPDGSLDGGSRTGGGEVDSGRGVRSGLHDGGSENTVSSIDDNEGSVGVSTDDVVGLEKPKTDTGESAVGGEEVAQTNEPAVDTGTDTDGTRPPVKKKTKSEKVALQVPYASLGVEGQSKNFSPRALIPANQALPVEKNLRKLVEKYGDLDEFVRSELGYKDKKSLFKALYGFQIDAVAGAIDNAKKGMGMIIADQTGMGKGRQAGAMIRWAKKQGFIPIFITAKKDLFTDMFRDLEGIDEPIAPFIMNENGFIYKKDGSVAISPFKGQAYKDGMAAMMRGELPEGTDSLFMTYSQIQGIDAHKAKSPALQALAKNGFLILDESHKAAGSAVRTRSGDIDTKKGSSNTFNVISGALSVAKGVTYLSATYAKRPETIPIYFRTALKEAFGDLNSLVDSVSKGGLPLQRVMSSYLAEVGQLVRRETTFEGISVKSISPDAKTKEGQEVIRKQEKASDDATRGLRAIVDFSKHFNDVEVPILDAQEVSRGGGVTGNASEKRSVEGTAFASQVHNYIKQLLLGLKADSVADRAIEAIRNGEKVVIALENTMGSFLRSYAEENGIKDGDDIENFDWSSVLRKGLDSTVSITKKDEKGDSVKERIPISKLTPEGRRLYQETLDIISGVDIDAPVSPIDWIRHRIAKEIGADRVGEITGRDLMVDYSGKIPTLGKRTKKDSNGVLTTQLFQSGKIDALIINESGSTGISLHADINADDQKPRLMLIVQPAGDINTYMQILGRTNRTGQVVLPSYEIFSAGIPAEFRSAAVLSGKLKKLNASTTSNSKSSISIDTADILNEVGDDVVMTWLEDNVNIADMIDIELDGDNKTPKADISRKASGRISILPIKIQRQFWDEVTQAYNDQINYLDSTGQNPLDVSFQDFEAKSKHKPIVIRRGTDQSNPFLSDSLLGTYSVKKQGLPMSKESIEAEIKKSIGGAKNPDEYVSSLISKADSLRGQVEHGLTSKQTGEIKAERIAKLNVMQSERRTDWNRFKPGTAFQLDFNGDESIGVVTKLEVRGMDADVNIFAPSRTVVTFHKNNGGGYIAIPVSILNNPVKTPIVSKIQSPDLNKIFDPEIEKRATEDRSIVTGNILSGFEEVKNKGRIFDFSMANGDRVQGIVMPRSFNPADDVRSEVSIKRSKDGIQFLSENRFGVIGLRDKVSGISDLVKITNAQGYNESGIRITVPATKSRGGKIFTNKPLLKITGDFTGVTGKTLSVVVPTEKAEAAIKQILKIEGELFADPNTSSSGSFRSPSAEDSENPDILANPSSRPGSKRSVDPGRGENHLRYEPPEIPKEELGSTLREIFDRIGSQIKKGLARPDTIRSFVRNRMQVPVNKGGISGKSRGIFRVKERTIRLGNLSNVDVLAHELGHHFSEVNQAVRSMFIKNQDELFKLTPKAYSKETRKLRMEEGFAEFFRLYLTQRSVAQDEAPIFFTEFTDYLEKVPTYKEFIEEISTMVNDWQGLSIDERFDAKVGKPPWYADFAHKFSGKELVNWFMLNVVSKKDPLVRMVQDLDPSLRASLDPAKLYQAGYGDSGVSETFLRFGTLPFDLERRADTRNWGKPLVEILEPFKTAKDAMSFRNYVIALRAQELKRFGKENLYQVDEIEAKLEEVAAFPEEKRARFEQGAKEIFQYNEDVTRYAVDGGLIPEETFEAFKIYNSYVPFFRVKDSKIFEVANRASGGLFKRLRGGSENINDIFENMIFNTINIVHATNRNNVLNQALRLAESVPGGGKWLERWPMPVQEVKISRDKIIDSLKGVDIPDDVIEEMNIIQSFFNQKVIDDPSNQIIIVKSKGQKDTKGKHSIPDGTPIAIKINDPYLFETLTNFQSIRLPVIDQIFRPVTRIFRATIVLSPHFWARNLIRGAVEAPILSNTEKGFNPFTDPVRGAKEIIFNTEMAKLFQSFGGGGATLYDLSKHEESIRKTKERLTGRLGIKSKVLTLPHELLDRLESAGALAENSNRMAEFMQTVKEKGMSSDALIDAAINAREVNVDFGDHGVAAVVQLVARSSAFWNARVQGFTKTNRTLVSMGKGVLPGADPRLRKMSKRKWLSGFLMLTIPTVLITLINRMRDDFQDREDWNINTTLAFKVNGQEVNIPKPWEVGAVFMTVPERFTNHFLNVLESQGDQKEFIKGLWTVLNDQVGGWPIPLVDSNLFLPPIEVWGNRSKFLDREITNYYLEKNRTRKFQFSESTSEFLKKNDVGKLGNLSPAEVQHLLRGYFNGLAMLTLSGLDAMVADGSVTKPEKGATDYPGLRTFFPPEDSELKRSKSVNDFYEIMGEITRQAGDYRYMLEEGMTDEAEKYLKEHPLSDDKGFKRNFGKESRKLSDINREINRLKKSPDSEFRGMSKDMIAAFKKTEILKLRQEKVDRAKAQVKEYKTRNNSQGRP